jgi:hypothetical protein
MLIDNPQSARITLISLQNCSVSTDGSAIMLISSRRPKTIPDEAAEEGDVSNAFSFFITGLCMARQKRKDPNVHPCFTPSSLERGK